LGVAESEHEIPSLGPDNRAQAVDVLAAGGVAEDVE
jgi:hypothetical protein